MVGGTVNKDTHQYIIQRMSNFVEMLCDCLETDRGAEEPALDKSQRRHSGASGPASLPYQACSRPTGNCYKTDRKVKATQDMRIAVVVAFFVCWAPFHAQRLIVLYVDGDLTKWTSSLMAVQNVLYFSSGIFYYVSSVINPILYNIMSLKFRQAFRSTILRPCRKKHVNRPTLLRRYRFNSKPLGTDTNMTLVHLQANGIGKYAHKLPAAKQCQEMLKYLPGVQCNSGDNSSGHRIPPAVDGELDCVHFEESSGDTDSRVHMHSYHHAPKSHRLIVLYVDGDLTKWTFSLMAVQNVMYFSSGIFYYISSVINPILYNIMSLKFRQAFRSTMPQKAQKTRSLGTDVAGMPRRNLAKFESRGKVDFWVFHQWQMGNCSAKSQARQCRLSLQGRPVLVKCECAFWSDLEDWHMQIPLREWSPRWSHFHIFLNGPE
ncbi:hypothetical protein CAPTEDRAFT_190732 [Capitella teleta]|uniref:G-protein coupled receptors family 1 profile domain-containing protein n=1 Tax=Capitella teleta TaxID=283909 RepID=R7V4H7_CAPTE|nr:hypothetical protein CAPTEDRAFT_190732 [Capitella teleta]|eukprot:ELU11261.1 hypothetical protein CAPTEDRAFT_190732 [Capitella teleta]